jgi:hypothetical protein
MEIPRVSSEEILAVWDKSTGVPEGMKLAEAIPL